MSLDAELYRRTLYLPPQREAHTKAASKSVRSLSVIDIHPEGASRTLVFIHGYGGSASQWLFQMRFFGQTMRVIVPDIRGHGLSDDPPELLSDMHGLVEDLEYVLDVLQVQRPFALIAHSFGGAVATEYVVLHPEAVSGLVLVGVPSRFILLPIVRKLLNIPDPIFSWIARKIQVALFAPQRTLKRMHDTIMAPWRGDQRLQQISVPTLVILGHRDTVFLRELYEDVPRLISGSHQVVIPVSAHLVQLERPDAVNRAIGRFIESIFHENVEKAFAPVTRNQTPLSHASRLAEKPWLQHYDNDVPEVIPEPKQLISELLSQTARSFPKHPAILFFGQTIDYRELDLLSNRFAHALRALGVQSGVRVAIVLPNIPQCIIAFYGTLKAGAVVVLGSPLSTEGEISYQLRNSEAQVLLTLSSYQPVIQHMCAHTAIRNVIYTDVREYLPLRKRLLIASLIESSQQKPYEEPAALPGLKTSGAANGTVSELSEQKVETVQNVHFASSHRDAHKNESSSSSFEMNEFQHLLRKQPSTPLESSTNSEELALLQYTSGTTDSPKGVMLSHRNLMVNVAQVRHWMPDARRGREVVLCALPLSHSYGVTDCMNLPVAIAGSIVLLPTTRTSEILAAVKRHSPSIFPGVPALYLAIANYPRVRSFGISSVRICVSGSAPLPVEVQEAFEKLTHGRLVEGYGLTEAAPVTHCNPLKGERRVGSIGIPLPSTTARIVDLRTGEPLPTGEVGELLVRGPQVMHGYWKMPEETAQVLTNGWLHTGDLARMDEDGFFTIVDRKKDLILSGSYNVYPRDVEEVLYEHPKVLEAAVVSTPAREAAHDGSTAPIIKAFVVLKRGEKATAGELLAFCRERLDAYKVPKQIEFRAELPKNFVGKVLRRLLVEA